jgi:hypothetical protein
MGIALNLAVIICLKVSVLNALFTAYFREYIESKDYSLNGRLERYFFDIKGEYMENWDFKNNMSQVDVHQIYVTLYKEDDFLLKSTPVSNVTVSISHLGTTTYQLLLNSGVTGLGPGQFHNVTTNIFGQISFGVIDQDLFLPYFCISAPFFGLDKSIHFPVDSYALLKVVETEDLYSSNSQWTAIKNLILPVLKNVPSVSVEKRNIQDGDFYDHKSGSIKYFTANPLISNQQRSFDSTKMDHSEWTFDFRNQTFSPIVNRNYPGYMVKRQLFHSVEDFCVNLDNATTLGVSSGRDGIYLLADDGTLSTTYIAHATLERWKRFFGCFLQKLGLGIAKILKSVKSVFNWNDIFINQKVLTSHFVKTIPWLRSFVTSSNSNFSTDVFKTFGNFNDFSQKSSDLLLDGNFSQVGDLISNANEEFLYKFINNEDNNPIEKSMVENNVQTQFITNLLLESFSNNEIEYKVSEGDEQSLSDITDKMFQGFIGLSNNTINSIIAEYTAIKNELKKSNLNWKVLLNSVGKLVNFCVELISVKLIESILVVFDLILSIFHKILSFKIYIPMLSEWFQQKSQSRTSEMTGYEIFSLLSVLSVTSSFKASHKATNMFTPFEAEVLIKTKNPDKYIDNLVSFALAVNPDKDHLQLRMMYRTSVSYILGCGYSTAQLISASIGLLPLNGIGLYVIRNPVEMLSNLCNFPWTWYTDTRTIVGVNLRFVAWLSQFGPLVTGWGLESHYHMEKAIYRSVLFKVFFISTLIPVLVSILFVFMDDLRLRRTDVNSYYSSTDLYLKFIGRFITQASRVMLALTEDFQEVQIISQIRTFILTGAGIQASRLYLDSINNSVYSV